MADAGKKPKTEEKSEPPKPLIDLGGFDWKSYIKNYSGHTKIARLIFIAENAKGQDVEALKLAIDEIKNTKGTKLYKDIAVKLGERGGPSYALDKAWIDGTDKKSAQLLERLETDLNGARTQLVRESIRLGHTRLGDAYYDRGDLNAALRCYVRTRDYCTTSAHIFEMCLNVIRVSIEMSNYAHVINYVSKAEQTPDLKDAIIIAKLNCSSGLAHLENRKYRQAARKFLTVDPSLGDKFSDVISPQDIAIYGGLSALASYERGELAAQVIENGKFKAYLDLVPEMRDVITSFYNSKYGACLDSLKKLETRLSIDIHLHDHVKRLYEKVREKAIKQYFSPFISVDMNKMAKAFNTPIADLESELTQLIINGTLNARIDSFKKVLYARQVNQRSQTFAKTLDVGDALHKETKGLILRVNLLKNDFVVKPPRAKEEDKRE